MGLVYYQRSVHFMGKLSAYKFTVSAANDDFGADGLEVVNGLVESEDLCRTNKGEVLSVSMWTSYKTMSRERKRKQGVVVNCR